MTLVPASSHGGAAGFAIGSSTLTAAAAGGQTGKAMGSAAVILWAAATIVGADLSVAAAPGNDVIVVATAGWYEFVVQAGVISATGTLATLHCAVVTDARASTAIDASVLEAYLWATTGPIYMAALDQINFDLQADNAASTGTFEVDATTTFVRATRLA